MDGEGLCRELVLIVDLTPLHLAGELIVAVDTAPHVVAAA